MATQPSARAVYPYASQVPGCHGVHISDSAASPAATAAHLSHEDAASESYIPVSGMSIVRVSKNRVLATGGTARDGRILPFSVVRTYDCDPCAIPPHFNWLPPLRITRSSEKEAKPCFPVPREAHTLTLDPTGKMLLLIGGRREGGSGEDGIGRSPSRNAPSGQADGAGGVGGNAVSSKPCGESLFGLRIHEDGDHAWEPVATQRAKSGTKHAVGPRFGHCAELRNVATASGRRAKASGAVYVHGGYSAVDATAPLATVHKLTVVPGSARRRDQYTCQWELIGARKPPRGKARAATGAGASVVEAPARAFHAATFLDSRYLVVHGGKTGPVEAPLSDVCGDLFVYDTETDKWSVPADDDPWNQCNRPSPRAHHSATAGVGPDEGHVVLFGGQMRNGDHSDELFRLKLLPGPGTGFSAQWIKRRVSPPNFFCGLSRCALVGFPDANEYLVLCGKGKGGPLETALQFQPFQEIYETVRESEVLRDLAAKEEPATASDFHTPGTDHRSVPSAPILQGPSASPFVSLPSHGGSTPRQSGAPSDPGVAGQPAGDSQPGGCLDGRVDCNLAEVAPCIDRESIAGAALPPALPHISEVVAPLSDCPEKKIEQVAIESVEADENVTPTVANTDNVKAPTVDARKETPRLQAEEAEMPSAVVLTASVHKSPRRTKSDTVPACSVRKRKHSSGRVPLPPSKRPRAPLPESTPETGGEVINGEKKAHNDEIANTSYAANEAVSPIAPRKENDKDASGCTASPVESPAANSARVLEFCANNEGSGDAKQVRGGRRPASSTRDVASNVAAGFQESSPLDTHDENLCTEKRQKTQSNSSVLNLVNDDNGNYGDGDDVNVDAEHPVVTRALAPPAETPPAVQGDSLPSHGGISPFQTVDEFLNSGETELMRAGVRGRGRGRARAGGRVRGAGRPRGRPRGSGRGRRTQVDGTRAVEARTGADFGEDLDPGERGPELEGMRRKLLDAEQNCVELRVALEEERAAKEMQQKFAEDAIGKETLLNAKLEKLRHDFNRDSSGNLGSDAAAIRKQLFDIDKGRLKAQEAEIAKLISEKRKLGTELSKALEDHQDIEAAHDQELHDATVSFHTVEDLNTALENQLTAMKEKLKTAGDVSKEFNAYKTFTKRNEENISKELEAALADTRNEKRAREEARKRRGEAIQEAEKVKIELSQRNRMCTDFREKNKDLEKEVKALSSALEQEKAKNERNTHVPAVETSTCLRARCRKEASTNRDHERALADKSTKMYELQARVESLTKAFEGQKDKVRRLDDDRQSAQAEAAMLRRTSVVLNTRIAKMERQLRLFEGRNGKLSALIFGVTNAVSSLVPLSENLQRASEFMIAGMGNAGDDVAGVVGGGSDHGMNDGGDESLEGSVGDRPGTDAGGGSIGVNDHIPEADALTDEHVRGTLVALSIDEVGNGKVGKEALSAKPASERDLIVKRASSVVVLGFGESGDIKESPSDLRMVSSDSPAQADAAFGKGSAASAPIQGERPNEEREVVVLTGDERTMVQSGQAPTRGKVAANTVEAAALVVEKRGSPDEREHEKASGSVSSSPVDSQKCGGRDGESRESPACSPEVEDKGIKVSLGPADARQLGMAAADAADAAIRVDTACIAMDDDSDDAPSP